jgi:hypothetical protein
MRELFDRQTEVYFLNTPGLKPTLLHQPDISENDTCDSDLANLAQFLASLSKPPPGAVRY